MSDDIDTILAKYGEDPRDNKVVWAVQGTRVIAHKALERVASKAKISFAKPDILRSERDEAVILVTGNMDTATEWSIGEAKVVPMVDSGRKNQWGKAVYEPAPDAIGNYQITPKQGAYPYAMAEKRAKDRVILKLLNLHGQAYSEEEADDFKGAKDADPTPPRDTVVPISQRAKATAPRDTVSKAAPQTKETDAVRDYIAAFETKLQFCDALSDIDTAWIEEKANRAGLGIIKDSPAYKQLAALGSKRRAEIEEEVTRVMRG